MLHTLPGANATSTPLDTGPAPLRLTPGQWRRILEDPSFLAEPENRYQRPRRLNGRPVEIVREA
jgi:hypothetical protein